MSEILAPLPARAGVLDFKSRESRALDRALVLEEFAHSQEPPDYAVPRPVVWNEPTTPRRGLYAVPAIEE